MPSPTCRANPSKNELVSLCRKAENEWVGLPCGILDQGTSAFGEANQVVRIDCDEEAIPHLPLPEGTAFWIFDTGIKHDLVDSHYGTRHQECMDALVKLWIPSFSIWLTVQGDLLRKSRIARKPENGQYMSSANRQSEYVRRGPPRVEFAGRTWFASSAIPCQFFAKLFENNVPELDHLVDLLNRMTKCWAPV